MKEQFLNLTGLTELVGYLKTSIANHKEILPYASNKLFPSVGDINTIYIDTATNTIYRWDSSSKTYITLAKAVKSVAISEATENGKITFIVDGNKTTVPIHGLGSAAYTSSSAYSPAGHTHTKAQVGLGNVDNTADANKSVKHATTADSATTAGTATNVSAGEGTADAARHVWFSDSPTETKRAYSDKFKYNPVTNNLTVNVTGNAATANSVAWGNVTGKPSTYAPSAHNHNDSTITSLNASKLFGTIDIARLPHGALERLVIVEDDTARFKLTTANIQLGDTVKVTKTEKMYYVIDESKLSSEDGYSVYTAGTATSVPWSGVTGKPSSYPPASHNHDERYYTETEMNSKLAEKAAKVHTHVKSEVGLGNVDNTADANKSVKYAASAGTAASCTGNAATATTATKLATARSINGTNFDGSGSITTATWGTARNITIGSIKKSVNGGADVSWSLSEIGAAAASHSHSYLPLSGGTLTGALNFANGTWNVVGDDVAIGDMNVGGTLGVMGKNGNTGIRLVQYGASTTGGDGAPGVSWTCTGANASTMSGTLSGTFSGNLSGTASRATLLAPAYTADTFSTESSTWRNGVTEGKVVWGQSWRDTSMSNDTGDLTIWIKQNGSVTTANMTIDGTINAIGGFIGSLSGNASSATALTSSAGSATQPVYFSGGKPVACSYTLGKSVPADAKFTDTNTWRGVQNNLTSTATDQSLSAAQGKVLNENKMSAVSANGYYGMARPDNNTSDWIRTTTNGLLPVQSGGRGSGHSSLGTSSWYFSQAYVDHVYTTDVKIADKVTLQYDSTNTCLNFVFS